MLFVPESLSQRTQGKISVFPSREGWTIFPASMENPLRGTAG